MFIYYIINYHTNMNTILNEFKVLNINIYICSISDEYLFVYYLYLI